MRRIKTEKLVAAGLLSALTCVATLVIQAPSPIGGYMNLGDCIVLLCGWLLGPLYGAVAAGIGSMLADLFIGYVFYAPATLIIKSLMAVVAYFVFRGLKLSRILSTIISGVCAEIVMVFGYFGYEAIFLKLGLGAAAGILSNLVQAAFGILCAVLLYILIDRKRLWKY